MANEIYYFITASSKTDVPGEVTHRHFWGDKKVKIGDIITIKDDEPERQWYVYYVGKMMKTKAMLGDQRGWHVGGL